MSVVCIITPDNNQQAFIAAAAGPVWVESPADLLSLFCIGLISPHDEKKYFTEFLRV